ncbi:MAG: sensor domain-containing protein [Mycobacterium sp.]
MRISCSLLAAAMTLGIGLAAAPVAAADPVDTLLLNVDEVRGIVATNADLTGAPPVDQPAGQHQYDADYPPECHAVFDQDVAFAGGYNQFRSVTYTGPSNAAVTQAVAVYQNATTARDALTTVGQALNACSESHPANLAVTTQVLDRATFALCQAQCSTIYRQSGPVLIAVSAVRFGDSDRIATAVLQQVTGRAKAL